MLWLVQKIKVWREPCWRILVLNITTSWPHRHLCATCNSLTASNRYYDYIIRQLKFYQIGICSAFLKSLFPNFAGYVFHKKSLLFPKIGREAGKVKGHQVAKDASQTSPPKSPQDRCSAHHLEGQPKRLQQWLLQSLLFYIKTCGHFLFFTISPHIGI